MKGTSIDEMLQGIWLTFTKTLKMIVDSFWSKLLNHNGKVFYEITGMIEEVKYFYFKCFSLIIRSNIVSPRITLRTEY